MASITYIQSLLNRLPAEYRAALLQAFEEAVKQARLGRPTTGKAAENFAGGFVEFTTHATPNTEASALHKRDVAPYLIVPVLDPQTVGSRLVDLQVSKAADDKRIYLKSTIASATVLLYVE